MQSQCSIEAETIEYDMFFTYNWYITFNV